MDDLEMKKLRKSNIILIILIVIIAIFVIGLGYYVYFVRDNTNSNSNDNVKGETNNNVEELDVSTLDSKLVGMITDFPYSSIIKEDVTYEELNKVYMLTKTIDTFKLVDMDFDRADVDKDSAGVTYPKYEENSAQYYGKILGLTVAEIKNMDVTVWNDLLGNTTDYYYIFDGDTFKNKMFELFGSNESIFEKSFIVFKEVLGESDKSNWFSGIVYDKNIDKVVYHGNGVTTVTLRKIYITSSTKNNDIYNIQYVEGYIEKTDKYILKLNDATDVEFSIENNDLEKTIQNVLIANKDKLNNYEISFKKVGDTYQFVSIDYVK